MYARFGAFLWLVNLTLLGCGASAHVGEPPSPAVQAETPRAARSAAPIAEAKLAANIQYGDPAAPPPRVDIPPDWIEHRTANLHPSPAYAWIDIVLEVTGREVEKVGARPTVISRQMAIPVTAM